MPRYALISLLLKVFQMCTLDMMPPFCLHACCVGISLLLRHQNLQAISASSTVHLHQSCLTLLRPGGFLTHQCNVKGVWRVPGHLDYQG